jgi:hypothetical protein
LKSIINIIYQYHLSISIINFIYSNLAITYIEDVTV